MIILKILLIISFLTLSSCSKPQPDNHQQTFYAFGTFVTVQIQGVNAATANLAIQTIEQDFHYLHKKWHAWDKGGIVSQINYAIANNKSITVTDEVKSFIQTSQLLAKQSNYIFDPAIGKLIALWSFHSADWQGPPPAKILQKKWLKNRPSIKHISFNNNQLISSNNQVQLDFGANAKGLALERAISYLKSVNIANAIVNIGGDMSVIGKNIAGKNIKPWQIGVQDPSNPQQIIAKAKIPSDFSIVTSGTYQRYFEWQGQRYSHLIDPNTAQPANTFASVSVIHQNPITADAAATAILIAGEQKWQQIATQMGITEVLIIDQQGKIINTSDKITTTLK